MVFSIHLASVDVINLCTIRYANQWLPPSK